MQQPKIKILVISIASPLLLGVYEDDSLLETFQVEGKTSDILPSLFEKVLKKYAVDDIIYVNGPGSYMAIKIAYIFLKTIALVKNINFYAISGFDLNNNSPIKALGKKYFFRDKDDTENIRIDFLGDHIVEAFQLPTNIKKIHFTTDILPQYNLPAV